VVIGGCRGSAQMPSEIRPLRTDVEWQLVRIEAVAPTTVTVDPTRYTVSIRHGRVGQRSRRLQSLRRPLRIEGAALTIGPALACTRAACAVPSLGDRSTAALTTASRYVQRERDLDLVYTGGTLRFRPAP
jgi:hypothetical protein